MRCFFMIDGRIAAVEILPPGLTDEEALEMGRRLFEERRGSFDGFEIWDRTRVLYQLPEREERSLADGFPEVA